MNSLILGKLRHHGCHRLRVICAYEKIRKTMVGVRMALFYSVYAFLTFIQPVFIDPLYNDFIL